MIVAIAMRCPDRACGWEGCLDVDIGRGPTGLDVPALRVGDLGCARLAAHADLRGRPAVIAPEPSGSPASDPLYRDRRAS